MSITIRNAKLEDLPLLLAFEQGVIEAERPFDPTLKQKKTNYYDIVNLITLPHIELLVAVAEGQVVGSGYARIETAKPYLQHDQFAYLGFMYVIPQFRGQGINKFILDGLKTWCRSRNITELRLEVYQTNEAAIRAYEKAGFIKHMITMRVEI